jgi:hypothetical protein
MQRSRSASRFDSALVPRRHVGRRPVGLVVLLAALLWLPPAAQAHHKIVSSDLQAVGAYPSGVGRSYNVKFVLTAESDEPCNGGWSDGHGPDDNFSLVVITAPDGKEESRWGGNGAYGGPGYGYDLTMPRGDRMGTHYTAYLVVPLVQPGYTVTLTLRAHGARIGKWGKNDRYSGLHHAYSEPKTASYKVEGPTCEGKITRLEGDVQVNGRPVEQVGGFGEKPYLPIQVSDMITTGWWAYVEIVFPGLTVRISGEKWREQLMWHDPCDQKVIDGKTVQCTMVGGSGVPAPVGLFLWAKRCGDGPVEIITARAVAGVRGSTFELSEDAVGDRTVMRVIEGTGFLRNTRGARQRTVVIPAGYSSSVQGDQEPTQPVRSAPLYQWK